MRIALVSEHANPLAAFGGRDAGGQHVHVAGLALALADRGHVVVVHTRRDDPGAPEFVPLAPGVRVHHVAAGPAEPIGRDSLLPYLPQFTRELARRWAARPPDLVHAHYWMSGIVSAQAASPIGLPLVATFHALGTVERRQQAQADTSPPCRLDAERALARHADGILATTSEEVGELVAMGADPAKVRVVPCGVDTAHFTASGPRRLERGERTLLLHLGGLAPRTGVDDAIRMLPWLPDAELVVPGGPAADSLDQELEVLRLRQVARELGVQERVILVGSIARPEVPALIRSADVVVSLPRFEPSGRVALEAMACGVPVVGSRVAGHVDAVQDGVTGILVPPQRPDVAAAAVGRLLENPEALRAMGRRGADRAARHHSWQRVAQLTEAAYVTLLARPAGTSEQRRVGSSRQAIGLPHHR